MVVHRHTGVGVWDILRVLLFKDVLICLRRVTFFPCRKKVTKERHSRGEGFRFPSPLKNPLTLKRPKGEGLRPLPFGNPHPGRAIIKSRLCREAAKVGGGQWPPLEKKEVPLKIVSPSLKIPTGEGFFAISPNFAAKICHTSRNVKNFPVRACNSGNAVLYSKHKCRLAQNPYRGFPFFVRAKNEPCWL